MSKAFDKINISYLQDTCKRIGIPTPSINFITELHSQRQAQIIIAFGLTSPVNIKSGIEQGETYSPLLWKIYYDPILIFISQKYQNHLLKISTQSPIDFISNTTLIPITIPYWHIWMIYYSTAKINKLCNIFLMTHQNYTNSTT